MAPSTKLEYQPAIDGLRAVAVALVLLFHGGWALFSGGYVGVSLFFTISGFLITSLLVHEFESTTTISISDF
jgi:peptidoglycan/LPS O-acetylase OafA/YrhL